MNSWRKPEDLKQQQSDYATKLLAMDDAALRSECNQYIWLSAYANNNPRSSFHWKCDACYDECHRRSKPEIYDQEHKKLSEQ